MLNANNSIIPNLYTYCDNDPVNCVDYTGLLTGVLLSTSGSVAATNAYNPVGWIAIIFTVVVGGLVIGTTWLDNISIEKSTTKIRDIAGTKLLPDIKVKEQSGKPYSLAYITIFGGMQKVGKKMSFTDALSMLGVVTTSSSVWQRFVYNVGNSSPAQRLLEHKGSGEWGIYADSQYAAKALATVFGSTQCPEVHKPGMYAHYHIINHQNGNHICHI